MKRLTQLFPILLAAALQIMPLLRNLLVNPATGSSFAFILRWGIGSAAAVGAVDAVSGASGTFMNSASNLVGTVGVPMSTNLIFVINGGNTASTSSDYFFLNSKINNGGVSCNLFFNGVSTNYALPPGLTIKCVVVNGASNITALLSGTPTTAMTTNITITAGYSGGYAFSTNLQISISGVSTVAPVITNQPVSITNLVGATPSFGTTAGGTAPLAYQWYFNTNTTLLNATNATLSLTNVTASQAGTYSVKITNSAGAITSTPAVLTVWQPPIITNQPVDVTTVAGGSASFSVTAGGIPTLTYQWQKSTAAQGGATAATLPFTGIRASQAGSYSVIITNSAGSVTSSVVSLVVTNPLPTTLTTSATSSSANGFQFTFTPIVGLTNTVQTNSTLAGGTWAALTNVPPPASATPVTVTDALGGSNRFYRVLVQP